MMPVVIEAPVLRSDRLGAYWVLTFRAPEIASGAEPGQFVNLRVDEGHLLRRPFSVYRSDRVEGTFSVAFDAIGEGTQWLSSRKPGDVVGVVGPLGVGFPVPADAGSDLLVGGGYGAAALAFLAERLRAHGSEPHGIFGGRSHERVFSDDVLPAACASITVVTDDGSAGARGLVTDPLPELIDRVQPRAVYACGPMRMLEAVSRVAERHGVTTFLAVEEFMACGIGVCWTCVLPVRANGDIKHARACTDGPVFEGAAVAWA